MLAPYSNPVKNHNNCDEGRRLLKSNRGSRKKNLGPGLESSRNFKLERKVVNIVSEEQHQRISHVCRVYSCSRQP